MFEKLRAGDFFIHINQPYIFSEIFLFFFLVCERIQLFLDTYDMNLIKVKVEKFVAIDAQYVNLIASSSKRVNV